MGKSAERRDNKAREQLSLRFREGALIAFSAIFVFLLVALSTYSVDDPSWSRTGNGGAISNAVGPVGAWFADVFYALFGYMAYLFPAMLGFQAVRIFRDRSAAQLIDPIVLGLRFVGFILVMMASTALAAISHADAQIPFGAGGVLGDAIGNASVEAFSVFGARLILVAILLFGLTIFTDLSWIALMDKLGEFTLGLIDTGKDRTERLLRWYRERRNVKEVQNQRREAVVKQIAKQKDRIPPKISPPKPKPLQNSQRVEKERQKLLFDSPVIGDLPPLQLLDEADHHHERGFSPETLEAMSRLLELKLADFNVIAKVVAVFPGPVITRFEIEPDAGVKVSKISNLAKDLARSLAVISVRVVEVIPGKPYVGIEIPNEDREIVNFREVLSSKTYEDSKSPLTLALGHDIS
ncbi:MAG: S-DNA-T family DNA segregation ATPase FtsK/SpoIIIE, partial [Bermanella sp.]